MKVAFYTIFALVAFALNSILCRLALGERTIDAAGFTAVRLLSGAVMLLAINFFFGQERTPGKQGNWVSAFFLFAYAICFSFAYLGLTTGTGALILFGSVQLTMIMAALLKGERPRPLEWVGLLLSLTGLVYLVLPGLAAPPLWNSILMAGAGIAWGFYTLRGRGSVDPLAETVGNFLRAVPMTLVICLLFWTQINLSTKGILPAVLSGAVASGIGYSIWYAALRFHTATRAAVLQLSVPIIAAFGGVIFLMEAVSMRLLAASALIIGGIGLMILARQKKVKGEN